MSLAGSRLAFALETSVSSNGSAVATKRHRHIQDGRQRLRLTLPMSRVVEAKSLTARPKGACKSVCFGTESSPPYHEEGYLIGRSVVMMLFGSCPGRRAEPLVYCADRN